MSLNDLFTHHTSSEANNIWFIRLAFSACNREDSFSLIWKIIASSEGIAYEWTDGMQRTRSYCGEFANIPFLVLDSDQLNSCILTHPGPRCQKFWKSFDNTALSCWTCDRIRFLSLSYEEMRQAEKKNDDHTIFHKFYFPSLQQCAEPQRS